MINLFWYNPSQDFLNVGDSINPYIVKNLSNKDVVYTKPEDDITNYFAAGSIFHFASTGSVIWGSGIIRKDMVYKKPKEICSVRGPLTRKIILDKGWSCPEIYGDPVLILSSIYKPRINKKYEIGIVPHYVDKNNPILLNLNSKNIKIIDVTKDPLAVVDDILSCNKILSSSLHGRIIADSYNIPSYWIKLSKKLLGENFKFIDYLRSVNKPETCLFDLTKNNKNSTDLNILLKNLSKLDVCYPNIDIDKIIKSCPFIGF